jgi:hypothetical protein
MTWDEAMPYYETVKSCAKWLGTRYRLCKEDIEDLSHDMMIHLIENASLDGISEATADRWIRAVCRNYAMGVMDLRQGMAHRRAVPIEALEAKGAQVSEHHLVILPPKPHQHQN